MYKKTPLSYSRGRFCIGMSLLTSKVTFSTRKCKNRTENGMKGKMWYSVF